MTMLAESVDVVIGVDTHKHTHTAAVVTASTGAAVEDLTVGTDPDGYAELLALADRHSSLRAWSIEGTGGYGAGLARFLAEHGELVIELDRPNRPARRNGAKSDPLDAVRAGREVLAREHLAQPRAAGERAAPPAPGPCPARPSGAGWPCAARLPPAGSSQTASCRGARCPAARR